MKAVAITLLLWPIIGASVWAAIDSDERVLNIARECPFGPSIGVYIYLMLWPLCLIRLWSLMK